MVNVTKRECFKIYGIEIVCLEFQDGTKLVESKNIGKLLSRMSLGMSDTDLENSQLDSFVMWSRS